MSDTAFTVTLAKSGQTFDIPADSTILDVLEFEGVSVPSSCQQGVCGTCQTTVLSGDIDHRDMVLMDDEKAANNTMMICCSRAKTNGGSLTLDI